MCIVSAISDGWYRPSGDPYPYTPSNPWTRRLDALDKKLGLRDCKDEQKEKFLAELAARVAEIEARLAPKRRKKSRRRK